MNLPQAAHPVLAVFEKPEEGVLYTLICQDIELCQMGQGGNREQIILVSLHMLEMNCKMPVMEQQTQWIALTRSAWAE